MNPTKLFRVEPGQKVRLGKWKTDSSAGYRDEAAALRHLQKNTARLAELQALLWAERKRALLIILQAMDAGGKDGTIRHVMSGVNPQGCSVTWFKVPSAEEAEHDFLWRIHKVVPGRGYIGIFNRSHYEDVLVVRVHELVAKAVWRERFDQINAFEKILAENDVCILKFFLHVSKAEQRRRLQARIDDPTKGWKIGEADFAERRHWDDYMEAYEDALSRCSTPWAPWFIIPADHKWFRNLAVSQVIVDALEAMDMKYPRPRGDLSKSQLR